MRNELIIKREDGSRVKIVASVYLDNFNGANYSTTVSTCEKGKRTWVSACNSDDYTYRRLSIEDRDIFNIEQQLKIVTQEELLQAKIDLWEMIKPT